MGLAIILLLYTSVDYMQLCYTSSVQKTSLVLMAS